jgi:hypothetical protein
LLLAEGNPLLLMTNPHAISMGNAIDQNPQYHTLAGEVMANAEMQRLLMTNAPAPGVDALEVVVGDRLILDGVLATSNSLQQALQQIEDKLNTVGDDAQLANADLQAVLQKQQEILSMISDVAKHLHCTALMLIRRIGG